MSPAAESDQPVRIVVIDDDPKNLKMVNFTLSNGELEIHTASDPRIGLDMITQLRPQIVLIDLILPGIGGMELLQQIVQLERGIAVILMTGYYSAESAREAIKMGAADYFPKPFSPNKLRERIELIVEDTKAPPAQLHHGRHRGKAKRSPAGNLSLLPLVLTLSERCCERRIVFITAARNPDYLQSRLSRGEPRNRFLAAEPSQLRASSLHTNIPANATPEEVLYARVSLLHAGGCFSPCSRLLLGCGRKPKPEPQVVDLYIASDGDFLDFVPDTLTCRTGARVRLTFHHAGKIISARHDWVLTYPGRLDASHQGLSGPRRHPSARRSAGHRQDPAVRQGRDSDGRVYRAPAGRLSVCVCHPSGGYARRSACYVVKTFREQEGETR